jgi:hypothetical protein
MLIDQPASAIASFEEQTDPDEADQGQRDTSATAGSRLVGRKSTRRSTVTIGKNQTVRNAQSQCSLRTGSAIPGNQTLCDAARPVRYAAMAPTVPSAYNSVAA